MRTYLIIPVLLTLVTVFAQNETSNIQGFITVSDTSKMKVILECGAKFMTVHMKFKGSVTPTFSRWIVVGTVNDPQCQKQGNGGLEYIVELPLTNDPCGTRMVEQGRFENTIRIGDHPGVRLLDDENILIRCEYGKPEIGTARVPFIPSTQSFESFQTLAPPAVLTEKARKPALAVGYVYLIVFLILFLALLFLICGGLYFFLKRRKLRLERRKRLLVAVPPGSELSKLGLSHLWWSGKSGVNNDALLSHDYMINTNTTRRGGLSVSTDYPGSSHSTSTASPDEGKTVNTDAAYSNESYIADANANLQRGKITTTTETTEEVIETTNYQKWLQSNNKDQATYAKVEVHKKGKQKVSDKSSHEKLDLDNVELAGSRTIISSVSHMYNPQDHDDRASDSTLEGKQYYTPEESEHSRWSPQDAIPLQVHENHVAASQAERDATEEFIKVVEEHEGTGGRKLTRIEKSRWRQLVESDANVQEMLLRSRTSDDFEQLSRHPQYAPLFPPEKWNTIVQALASVSFMRRLNNMIDTPDSGPTINYRPPHTSSGRYLKKAETESQPRKVSPEEMQAMSGAEIEATQPNVAALKQKLEKRIFTRESYARVKQEMEESLSSDEGPGASKDCSTTEFTEGAATCHGVGDLPPDHPPPPPPLTNPPPLNSQSSGIYESHAVNVLPPTLNVYMGNVPDRGLPRGLAVAHPPYSNPNMYSTSSTTNAYDNWQSSPDEL